MTGAYLCLQHKVEPVKSFPTYNGLVGHRELPGTGFFRNKQDNIVLRKTCPGMTIDLDVFREKVTRKIQETINVFAERRREAGTQTTGSSTGERSPKTLAVDGIYGPATRRAIQGFSTD